MTFNLDYISQMKKLTPQEYFVIVEKGTDKPFTGEYTDTFDNGIYVCRRCEAALYHSKSKFHSGCGWPSFDDEIENAITKVKDKDGLRTEIICSSCQGHLGHVVTGENLTAKDRKSVE